VSEIRSIDLAATTLVAFNLSIAYPLLDLLGRNAEFFVAHDASRLTVALVGVVLVAVIPGMVIGSILVIGLFSPRAASLVHRIFIGVMLAALALQVLKRTTLDIAAPPLALIAIALFLGATASWAWFRYGPNSGRAMSVGLAVPIVVLVLFGMTDAQGLLLPASAAERAPVVVGNSTPVVMVIFDELPVASLIDGNLEIDRATFPNFASLAADGTWYRNTTSVASHTRWAVPALLTGSDPPRDTLPTSADHPDNIFTILGDVYRVEAMESMTALCPQSVCAARPDRNFLTSVGAIISDILVVTAHVLSPTDWTPNLPAIDEGWADFRESPESDSFSWDPEARLGDLVGQFRTWLTGLPATDDDNVLFFAHSILAHKPWRYLPSGHEYPNVLFAGLGERGWGEDPWLIAQAYQRHLLQAQAADTMLGELLEVLKSNGMYENSFIVVTADHGISMQMGVQPRAPRENTMIDIAAVPLIVKYPDQDHGSVSDQPAQTIDVWPTIADVLDLDPIPSAEGASLLSESGRDARQRSMETSVGLLEMPGDIESALSELVEAKSQLLGDVSGSLFDLAPPGTSHLLGTTITELTIAPERAPFSAEILNADSYNDVDFDSPSIPALLGANVDTRLPADEHVRVVVGVNGRVGGITRTFSRGDKRRSEFSAMINPEFLKPGRNEITLHVLLEDSVEEFLLQPIDIVPES